MTRVWWSGGAVFKCITKIILKEFPKVLITIEANPAIRIDLRNFVFS